MGEYNQIPKLQTMLVDLTLDRVDVVHTGSNTRADILLAKGKEQNNMPETFEALLGLLKPEQANIVKSHIVEIEKKKDEAITALNEKVETLEKAVVTPPAAPVPTEEDIFKGASPELKEQFEKMRSSMDSMLEREAESLAKARFESVKAIPYDEAKLKEVLKSASPAVMEVLQKAAKAIEDNILTAKGKEVAGKFPAVGEKSYEKLEKAAKELQTADTALSYEQAFTKACSANPEVYAEYVKGVK